MLQLPLASLLVRGDGLTELVGREIVFWLLTVALIAYVRLFERRPMSSVGLGWPKWGSVVFGLGGAVATVGAMALMYMSVLPSLGVSPNQSAVDGLTALPAWFRVLLIIRAAVFEELFYRGFMIERLTQITGRRWLAALISLVAFTLAHLSYWGWVHLIIAGLGGLVLTGLYLWRRDLAANMIAHFATDAVGLLLG